MSDSPAQISLPQNCDLAAAIDLHEQIKSVDGPIDVQAEAVTHFDWPVAQLLIALAKDPAQSVSLKSVSERMADDVSLLGLSSTSPFSEAFA